MSNANRDLAVRWFEEVWNKGRREAIAELMAADGVIHDGETVSRGPEGFYGFFDQMHGTFSDMHLKVEKTIAEGDLVCVRWSVVMKHTGPGLGVPPTGKAVKTTGISIVRAAHGKLVEAWQNWDMFGLLEQVKGSAGGPAPYIGAVGA